MKNLRTESFISTKKAVNNIRKHGLGIPVRYLIVILSAFINCLSYTMRTNLNLTIVAMVKRANISHIHTTCGQLNQSSDQTQEEIEGSFDWSESMQGVVLGAYYYGYIPTNVIAGQLADWIGPKWLIAGSVLSSAVLTLVIPVCAFWSVNSVIVVRVITGLVQGVLTPSLYTMLAYWVPLEERGISLAMLAVGGYIGAVVTSPLSAALSQHGFAGGWPSVFYVLGILGCFAFIPWVYQVYNSPLEHPRIKDEELQYIRAHVTVSSKRKKKTYVPWLSIVTSWQVWVILITKFCSAWGNLFLMTKLPTYLESVLHLSMNANGAVNAGIYITYSASLMLFGYISDLIERKRLLNRTVSRKVFQTIGMVGSAALMVVVPSVGCDQTAVILLLIFGMVVLGVTSGGENPIVVDVAPDYSGSIYGFQNSFCSLPGFLAPLVVGLVLDGDPSTNPMTQWNILFYLAAGIYVFGAVVFALFISAKPQAWGRARLGTIRLTIDETSINGSIYIKSRNPTICTQNNDTESQTPSNESQENN